MTAPALDAAPRALPTWSTACTDWEDRIVAGRSLVPFEPLFPKEADAALKLFNSLEIVDASGRPTMGEACKPWAFDLPRALFGAYDAESGERLIQFFFELVAKKNSKSTRAAAIMVTALIRNWRDSGEFYILAPTKEIADNSFFPARDMVRANPNLREILHIQENHRLITHRNKGAFLKVVAADSETVAGKKTIGLLVDELWLFGRRADAGNMIREAQGGLASRPEGFVIYLSTQSNDRPSGVFAQKLEEFRAIRDGKVHDPRSLGTLYEFPQRLIDSGDYRKPEFWHIPNPNLGISVAPSYITSVLAEAERAGQSEVVNVLAKHLNVQVGMAQRADGWAGAQYWNRGVDRTLTLDTLLARSEVVTVGLDGGGLDDLLGVGAVGRERITKRWLIWAHALISLEGLKRRKANAERYLEFKRAGDLTVFAFDAEALADPELEGIPAELLADVLIADVPLAPGANAEPLPADIKFVVDLAWLIKETGLLAQVGVDAAGIGAIVDALAQIDVTQDAETLDAVRQGIALMGAIHTIERMLAARRCCHGDQPLLRWCAGNLRIVPTATAKRAARDESGYGKIDPLMAVFNAAHLMSLNPEAPGASIFDNAAWWEPSKDVVAVPRG